MGFRQCHLVRSVGNNTSQHMTSWLPEDFAGVGRVLELKDRQSDRWENGWKVTHVGRQLRSAEDVTFFSRDHLRQRKASDV